MASVLAWRTISPEQLTPAQRKFWTLLQDEQNRALPPLQLAQRAGYQTATPWYAALKDEAFRTMIESLGMTAYREYHEPEMRGVVPLAEHPDAEWAKDVVDVRRLVSDYPKHLSASALKLHFSFLSSPALKAVVKRYFRARLGFWQPASLRSYLRWLKPFLWNLENTYPGLASFAPLTRAMIEPILTATCWVDERGRRHAISLFTRRYMVIAAEGMFTYMQRHEWEEAPRHYLIYDEDRPPQAKKRPRPIPEPVLDQLQAHAHLLPPYAHNLVTILGVAGLRAIDALHLTAQCLEVDATGDPRLHWYNHKMKRDGRPLPVTTEVAEAIKRQQTVVKNIPDLFGKHYLFRTQRGLYKFAAFCEHLNELARQVPILGSDGQVYRFKPHAFRHTVGTQMINNGMGIADVMAYLDHMSPEMTLRYAEIDDDKLKQKFKALVLSGQAVGGAALKALKEQLEKGDESELDWVVSNLRKLSLPWGQCLHHAKANKCPYGQNACFTKDNGPCHKLVTTPEHAPVIIATMEDLKRSKQIADEKGWEMYANDLRDQIKGMEQVLAELELPPDQRPRNRGGRK
jgi:integrase